MFSFGAAVRPIRYYARVMLISGQCAIVGIGQTPFTRGTDKSTLGLHLDAALEAIADAGLTPADIDGAMPNELAGTVAEDFILNLGLPELAFSSTIRTGGASFASAIQSAALAVHGGVAKHVRLAYPRAPTPRRTRQLAPSSRPQSPRVGLPRSGSARSRKPPRSNRKRSRPLGTIVGWSVEQRYSVCWRCC